MMTWAINIIMGLLSSASGKKNVIIGLAVAGILGYIAYMNISRGMLKKELRAAKDDTETRVSKVITKSSNEINNIRFKQVADVLDGVKYEAKELPEDYVDPDYGKIFKFGYEE